MKRIFAFILAVILILMMTVTVIAKTVIVSGDFIYELIDNGSAFGIDSYSGEMTDLTIHGYYNDLPIISIGNSAFADKHSLVSVTIEDGVKKLESHCFSGCDAMQKVTLPSSLIELEMAVFSYTTSLIEINMSDTSVNAISHYCFSNSGLSSLALPDSCLSIGNCAFQNCESLASVTIPSSVTEIADTAFSGCEKLVIYASYGSYAIDYAIAHGIDYVYSDLEAYTFKIGDADGDGDITIMDATRVQRVLAKFDDDADGMISLRAAMDDDKVLGIMDATRIQRMLANFDDPYHIGESMTVYLSTDGKVIDAADDSAKSE